MSNLNISLNTFCTFCLLYILTNSFDAPPAFLESSMLLLEHFIALTSFFFKNSVFLAKFSFECSHYAVGGSS